MLKKILMMGLLGCIAALLLASRQNRLSRAFHRPGLEPHSIVFARRLPAGPGDCLPVGPSAYRTEMAFKGLTFPITSLPTYNPNFELTFVDQRYGQVNKLNAPVYARLKMP